MNKNNDTSLDRTALVDSLVGIIPNGATIEEGKEEKLNRHNED